MTTKICNKCNIEKKLDCFSSNGKKGLKSFCKQCRTATELQRRKENIDAYKEKDKAYHEKNKEERNAQAREYRKNNSEILNANAREKYQKNKDVVREYHQNRKETRNAVKKKRMDNNPQARIKESLMTRMSNALHSLARHKMSKLLGCSPDFLSKWLESKFYDDISWGNYGSVWHIDHVVPVAFFDLLKLEEQLICFHWSNLRPLYAEANLQKSDKLLEKEIISQQKSLKSYCEKLDRYQTDYESSWWRRLELRYGKNPEDDRCFNDILKWVIRNQVSCDEQDIGSTTK
jgi:hypothetical protein